MPTGRFLPSLRARVNSMRREDPSGFRVRAVLGFVLLLLVVHLAFGDNPWQDGIAKRLRNGDNVRPIDIANTWLWWLALVNALLTVLLLATVGRWLRPGEPVEKPALAPPRGPKAIHVVGVLAAMAACAVLAYPRLSQSLWRDEEWTVRRTISGYYHMEDGQVEFESARWRDAFFEYRRPTNHVFFSLLAKGSDTLYRAVARPELRFVSESVVRLPAYVAGIAAIGALGWLLWRLSVPWAGVFAAWILALHPWHLRYASEARGYSLLMLLLTLALGLLVRAVHRGTWARWSAYGGAQFLLLWTWPAAALVVALMNLAALVLVSVLARDPTDRRGQWTRLLAVNLFGAMAWAQFMVPNLMQVREFVSEWRAPLDGDWVREILSHFLVGVDWSIAGDGHMELAAVARAWPGVFEAYLVVVVGLLLLGLVRMFRMGLLQGLVAVVPPLGCLLTLGAFWARSQPLYMWYLIFALPGMALLAGVGIDWVRRALVRAPLPSVVGRPLAAALFLAPLLVFAVGTQPIRHDLRSRALQPHRDSVELIRSVRDPKAPENQEILTASFYAPARYYDPRCLDVGTPAELERLLARADRENKPLYINYGRLKLAHTRKPEMAKLVADPELFEEVAALRGFVPTGDRMIYRYRGKSGSLGREAAPEG